MKDDKIITMADSSIASAQKVWHAIQGIWYADGLAHTLNSLQVHTLPGISGDWGTTLAARAAMLSEAGGKWHEVREQMAAPLLAPIVSYDNSFSVLNEHLAVSKDMDAESIICYMQNLYDMAKAHAAKLRQVKHEFELWKNSVDNVFSLVEESIEEGWSALDVEEISVSRLTGEIAVLLNTIADLQDDAMPGILKKEGKFAKSFGKIVYTGMVAGKAVSFLSAGGLFFTVGSTFYEIFSNYSKAKTAIEEIQKCKTEFNLRQQALAQTKSLLRFLQKLQIKVVLLENEFGEIVELWEDEKSFLGNKLSSFRSGADPQKTNLVAKAATWETMSEFAQKFLQESYRSDSFELEI